MNKVPPVPSRNGSTNGPTEPNQRPNEERRGEDNSPSPKRTAGPAGGKADTAREPRQ